MDVDPEFISIDGSLRVNRSVVESGLVTESALDIQTIYSIIWPKQIRLYQVGGWVNMDSVGTFNTFLDALMSLL
jgi:tripeptidyl-peptidase-1